jgi:uncharacterized membrane protein YuzA (DUF378 family)
MSKNDIYTIVGFCGLMSILIAAAYGCFWCFNFVKGVL